MTNLFQLRNRHAFLEFKSDFSDFIREWCYHMTSSDCEMWTKALKIQSNEPFYVHFNNLSLLICYGWKHVTLVYFSAGNYRTQLYDKQKEEYLPATQGLGMFVEVKDPDDKVNKKIEQWHESREQQKHLSSCGSHHQLVISSWLNWSVCLLQVILSRQYGSEGRFTFTSHTPGEHQICLHSNSSKFSLFAGGMLVRRHSTQQTDVTKILFVEHLEMFSSVLLRLQPGDGQSGGVNPPLSLGWERHDGKSRSTSSWGFWLQSWKSEEMSWLNKEYVCVCVSVCVCNVCVYKLPHESRGHYDRHHCSSPDGGQTSGW